MDADDQRHCPICLEELAGLRKRSLICGHTFHEACIHTWLKDYPQKNCPCCRTPLSELSKPPTHGNERSVPAPASQERLRIVRKLRLLRRSIYQLPALLTSPFVTCPHSSSTRTRTEKGRPRFQRSIRQASDGIEVSNQVSRNPENDHRLMVGHPSTQGAYRSLPRPRARAVP